MTYYATKVETSVMTQDTTNKDAGQWWTLGNRAEISSRSLKEGMHFLKFQAYAEQEMSSCQNP